MNIQYAGGWEDRGKVQQKDKLHTYSNEICPSLIMINNNRIRLKNLVGTYRFCDLLSIFSHLKSPTEMLYQKALKKVWDPENFIRGIIPRVVALVANNKQN